MLPRLPGTKVSRIEWTCVCVILTAGAALRFTALGSGVPAAVASDEPFIMERVVVMMKTGELNPAVFDYPGLYMYLQTAVAVARYLTGTLRGEWFHLDEVIGADFYLWGRALTAALGTLTVLLIWRTGRRISPAAGLFAAGLLAIQPQHVRESHFVLTDVPMTFFVTLALLLSIRAHEQGTARAFLWAGAAVGLAAATKYTAVVAIVVPLSVLAWDARRRLTTPWFAVAVVGGASAAYLAGAPYTVLDLPRFLNGFGHLAMAHAAGLPPDTPAWQTYIRHLELNLGRPLALVCAISIAVALVQSFRGPDPARVVWTSSGILVLVVFVSISGQTVVFGRYLMPLLPPLLLLAGASVATGLHALGSTGWPSGRWRTAAAALLLVGLVARPIARTTEILDRMHKTSSNELAYDWIVRNVRPGSRVVVEAEGMLLPRSFATRQVARLIDHSYEFYRAEGAEYVVASSHASGGAMRGGSTPLADAYRDLLSRMELVRAVAPTPDHPGSEILVYRMIYPAP